MEPSFHYQPISVDDTTTYDPMNGTVRAKRVNFKHADGSVSYVVIPYDKYNVETVTAELQRAADQHAQVMNIRGHGTSTSNPWG